MERSKQTAQEREEKPERAQTSSSRWGNERRERGCGHSGAAGGLTRRSGRGGRGAAAQPGGRADKGAGARRGARGAAWWGPCSHRRPRWRLPRTQSRRGGGGREEVSPEVSPVASGEGRKSVEDVARKPRRAWARGRDGAGRRPPAGVGWRVRGPAAARPWAGGAGAGKGRAAASSPPRARRLRRGCGEPACRGWASTAGAAGRQPARGRLTRGKGHQRGLAP